MKNSLITSSITMTAAYVFGHALGFVLMLAANHLLDGAEFGLFYTAWMLMTVATAPINAVLMVLGRVLAAAGATLGRAAIAGLTVRILGVCLRWGIPAAIVAGILLFGGGRMFARDDLLTLSQVPAAVLFLSVVEIFRTSFQAMLLFRWSSVLWLASQTAQVVLSLLGLAISHRVWPAILGIVVGAGLVAAAAAPWFVRQARKAVQRSTQAPLRLGRETRLVISYSLFVLMTNMDILIGYRLLPTAALGVYAASSLLPKAIITGTLPISQVVLPVLVGQRARGLAVQGPILKALALVVSMAAAAAILLWVVVPFLQSSPFAIRGLDFPVMLMLALGAVGLSALRVLVVVEMALQRVAGGLSQALAITLFVGACMVWTPYLQQLAELYVIVAWACLIVVASAVFLPMRPNSSRVVGHQQP